MDDFKINLKQQTEITDILWLFKTGINLFLKLHDIPMIPWLVGVLSKVLKIRD